MTLQPITSANRERVNAFLRERWFSTGMAVRGELVDMTVQEGLLALDEAGEIAGLVLFRLQEGECEILSLDSLRENQGIGSRLLEEVERRASEAGCRLVRLITTNDNIHALRFYQKRGYDMARLYRNILERERELKPSIPRIGEEGIPLRHEIEFEKILNFSKSDGYTEGHKIEFQQVGEDNIGWYGQFEAQYLPKLSRYQSRIRPHHWEDCANLAARGLLCWYYILLDGIPVGSVWLEKERPEADSALLGIFILGEELRGKGIGRKAIGWMLSECAPRMGLDKAELSVRADNPRASACYRRCGFKETGDRFNADGIHIIHMEKRL